MKDLRDQKCSCNSEIEKNKIYWNTFYQNTKMQEESSFCKFVKSYNKKDYFIVDIGCGVGRDTFSFAKDGYKVVGIDRSEEAIQYNNVLKNKEVNMSNNIEFFLVDINHKEDFDNLIKELCKNAESQGLSLLAYLRFFIHAIDKRVEEIVLSTLSKYLKKGDYFAAEFRTRENKYQKKIYKNHYRRYIDAEDFLNDLESTYKFEKEFFQKGTGLAIYNDEDPCVCRILAKRI